MSFKNKEKRDHLAAWCNIISGGAFVGGFMFNTLGMGQDLRLAFVGLSLVFVFLLAGYFLKGGK